MNSTLNCELQSEKALNQDEKTRMLEMMGYIILLLEECKSMHNYGEYLLGKLFLFIFLICYIHLSIEQTENGVNKGEVNTYVYDFSLAP